MSAARMALNRRSMRSSAISIAPAVVGGVMYGRVWGLSMGSDNIGNVSGAAASCERGAFRRAGPDCSAPDLKVATDERACAGQRATPRLKVRIPQMPGMDHVRPNL